MEGRESFWGEVNQDETKPQRIRRGPGPFTQMSQELTFVVSTVFGVHVPFLGLRHCQDQFGQLGGEEGGTKKGISFYFFEILLLYFIERA